MKSNWRWLFIALLVMVLAACVPVGAALGPQVQVTRVPLQLTPSVYGLGSTLSAPLLPPGSEGTPVAASTPTAPADQQAAALRPLQSTLNILLLGTDERDLKALGNTDTIMVLAIDQQTGRAALISFPRDLYIPVPGIGHSRINIAYPFGEERQAGGGLPLLMGAIERNFGIPLEKYVRIDFSGFQQVIDALGGVDVTVDCDLTDELMPRYFAVETLAAGEYHMSGVQALYYARSRKTTDDFDRSRRQQRVLVAVRNRVLEANLIPRIPDLWKATQNVMDTNLSPAQIIELAQLGATLDAKDLRGLVIREPLVAPWITSQGGYVLLPDMPAINSALDNIWQRAPIQQTSTADKLCP
ncbi:MAG: LCP family protein [Caldilineales bacterium]